MGCIKGLSWLHVWDYLSKHFSEEELEQVKKQLEPADREALFDKAIFEMSWVDMGAYVRFSNLADKLLGHGDNELIKAIEHSAVREQLKGIYRFLLPLFSWKFAVKKTSSVWRTYFNCGTIQIDSETETSITFKLTGYPDMPPDHSKFQEYYVEELMRMCGIKNPVSTHPKCVARGDDCCLYTYEWEEQPDV